MTRAIRLPRLSPLLLTTLALLLGALLLFAAAPAEAQSAPTGKPFITDVHRIHLGHDVWWRDYITDDSNTRRDASVTGYDVQYRVTGTTTWNDHSHIGTRWFARITGLVAGNQYDIRVRKTNAAGNGPWSDVENVSSAVVSRPSQPDPPLGARVTPGNGKATFSWIAPTHTGGKTIVGYRISVRGAEQGSTFSKNVDVSGATTTSGEVTGLTNGTEYEGWVHTRDADGVLGASTPRLSFTPRASTRQVSFAQSSYSVAEGASVTLTVNVSPALTTASSVNVTTASVGTTAASSDYSVTGLTGLSLTLPANATTATFTVAAVADSDTEDPETIEYVLEAVQNADYVVSGSNDTAVVTISDDLPSVTVSFGAATYSVAEGSSVTVTVTLSADPKRTVTIPITKSNQGGATSADYSGVPANVTFNTGETSKSITFAATSDSVDDDGESVTLGFGTLPTGVSAGTISTTSVSITDDDTAGVTVSQTTLTVQGGAMTTYTVVLDSQPTANVVVGATSGTPARATVAPASRTFTTTNWNMPQTFTVTGVASGSSTIAHAATSTDPKYPSNLSIGSVTVTVTEPTTTTTTPTGTLPTLTASMSTDPVREDWETNSAHDLWSPTLTARELRSATASAPAIVGCDDSNASARCRSVLTDRDFTFKGVAYTVKAISYNQRKVAADINTHQVTTYEESLKLTLDKAIPESFQSCLTLHSGNAKVPFADDGVAGAGVDVVLSDSNRTITLTEISGLAWGMNWSASNTVKLRLPNVGCLTLTLSLPVDAETSLQWRRGGTADSSDYQRISLPTFAKGSTTAHTTIKPVNDCDVEGTETIVLDMTMWPGTDRAVHHKYTVYIEDDDTPTKTSCPGGL